MARPLRIQYPGAVYHATHRGNDRKVIFKDDIDGENQSGWVISLNADGNVLAISAPYDNGGSVKIYEYGAGGWTQKGSTLNADNSADNFGWSVSLNSEGDIVNFLND